MFQIYQIKPIVPLQVLFIVLLFLLDLQFQQQAAGVLTVANQV